MKATEQGHRAETAVVSLLEQQGFEIIDRNWKTRLCEIDIVAEKDKVIYFIEAKYRATDSQGNGLDYITAAKLKQMEFSANLWVQNMNWRGDYRLMAASVSGDNYEQVALIEIS